MTGIEGSVTSYILYGTTACHLCELAEELIRSPRSEGNIPDICKVDISESDALFERYGIRIPVLAHVDGEELDWPFSAADLSRFFNR